MTGVRWRDGEPEGRCDACNEYLPLVPEFWGPSLRRCRVCVREGRPASDNARARAGAHQRIVARSGYLVAQRAYRRRHRPENAAAARRYRERCAA